MTMVAVPTLLLNEKQVHRLVEDLEVRYLGNHENLHFALLTDMADAERRSNEEDPLVELCSARLLRAQREIRRRRYGTFALYIAIASTTRAKVSGWAGSASAASCSTSTNC